MRKIALTLAILTLAMTAQASSSSTYLKAGVFPQAIDHFGQASGSFSQRYWVDSEFASGPDAPVIFRLCGEDTGDYFVKTDSSQYFAKVLHANVVYLEHRYYGQSQPFTDQSNEHMRYLTLDNVIEDTAAFEKAIARQQGWTGKWIALGGSYSGTLSAIYRLRHPELVVGALAASAPMFTQNFPMDNGDLDEDPDVASPVLLNPPDMERAWAYESCTTFGFWVYEGGGTIYQPSTNLCSKAFNLSSRLNYDAYNQTYFAPFASGSVTNVLFTSGSDDPWNQLSINSQNDTNRGVTTLLIQGAGHHFDLNLPTAHDSQAVLAARAEFVELAQKWLGLR